MEMPARVSPLREEKSHRKIPDTSLSTVTLKAGPLNHGGQVKPPSVQPPSLSLICPTTCAWSGEGAVIAQQSHSSR